MFKYCIRLAVKKFNLIIFTVSVYYKFAWILWNLEQTLIGKSPVLNWIVLNCWYKQYFKSLLWHEKLNHFYDMKKCLILGIFSLILFTQFFIQKRGGGVWQITLFTRWGLEAYFWFIHHGRKCNKFEFFRRSPGDMLTKILCFCE